MGLMDWGAVSTGVVGLAGIGGTLWQGKRGREAQGEDLRESLNATAKNLMLSIQAERELARIAEKRRIYAAFHTSLDHVITAEVYFATHVDKPDRQQFESDTLAAVAAMFNAMNTVRLIAPIEVYTLTHGLAVEYGKDSRAIARGEGRVDTDTLSRKREELYRVMRADLDEPTEPAQPDSSR